MAHWVLTILRNVINVRTRYVKLVQEEGLDGTHREENKIFENLLMNIVPTAQIAVMSDQVIFTKSDLVVEYSLWRGGSSNTNGGTRRDNVIASIYSFSYHAGLILYIKPSIY